MIICRNCRIIKPDEDFILNRGNRQTLCKQCMSEYSAKRNIALRVLAMQRVAGTQHPKCVCCGESTYEFLVLDHKNGDGKDHRSTLKHPNDIVKLLRHSDCVGHDLQILCHNCNSTKGSKLECAHTGVPTGTPPQRFSKISGAIECACCGLADYRFLTVDHVDGDGSAHRSGVKKETPYRLQLLCWNCNMAKGTSGDCPHKTGTRAVYLPVIVDRHRVSDTDAARMVELAGAGCSLRSIAKETGYPHITVTRVLRKAIGNEATDSIRAKNHVGTRIGDDERVAIATRFQSGESIASIAHDLGRSIDGIRFMLNKVLSKEVVDAACRVKMIGANLKLLSAGEVGNPRRGEWMKTAMNRV